MNFGRPAMSRLHTTKTGITIGGKYEPPMRQLNADEENWQKVYLQKDSTYSIAKVLKIAAGIVFYLAFCLLGYWYGN